MFLALAAGFAVGPSKLAAFTLRKVLGTPPAGVLIGQLGDAAGLHAGSPPFRGARHERARHKKKNTGSPSYC